jgi:hypothetical protein
VNFSHFRREIFPECFFPNHPSQSLFRGTDFLPRHLKPKERDMKESKKWTRGLMFLFLAFVLGHFHPPPASARDDSGDAPKAAGIHFRSGAGERYVGNSGDSPYDLYKSESVSRDELFIADTGGDLDQYLYKDRSPLTFHIPVDRFFGEVDADGRLLNLETLIENGVIAREAILKLQVFDVDDDYQDSDYQPELDKVRINGYELKDPLSSGNNQWSTRSYTVPVEHIRFPSRGTGETGPEPALNRIEILIDLANPGMGNVWAVEVDWGVLEIRGLHPVVLIHGFRGGPDTWENFVPFLEDAGLPFFLPGVSGSDPIGGWATIKKNSNALVGVVDEAISIFGVEKIHLVAHSKGGLDSRMFLRNQVGQSEMKIISLIQLSTPNHGSIAAQYATLDSGKARNALKSLNSEWISHNFNYEASEDPIRLIKPFNNKVIFIPLYYVENSAVPIHVAIGDRDRWVDERSATLPWCVECKNKYHGDSPTDACPWILTVKKRDANASRITWPIPTRVNFLAEGLGHSEIHGSREVFAWVMNTLREIERGETIASKVARCSVASTETSGTSARQLRNGTEADPIRTTLLARELTLASGEPVSLEFEAGSAEELEVLILPLGEDGEADIPDAVLVSNAAEEEEEGEEETDEGGEDEETNGENENQEGNETGNEYPGILVETVMGPAMVISVPNPSAGSWTLRLSSAADQPVLVQVFEIGGEMALAAYASSIQYDLGEAVYLAAEPTRNGTPILDAEVNAEIHAPSGDIQIVVLYDDGTNGDPTAGDGMYVTDAYVPAETGEFAFVVRAEGEGYGIQSGGFFKVARENARFLDEFHHEFADTDGDGLADELRVFAGIDFATPGRYEMFGNLLDEGDFVIDAAYRRMDVETAGEEEMVLIFSGARIENHGASPPFFLSGLILRFVEEDSTFLADFREMAYAIEADEDVAFQRPLIRLSGPGSDRIEDDDGDGRFDRLIVALHADVVRSGRYRFNARLVTPEGVEIEWDEGEFSAFAGVNEFELEFDGRKIRRIGENGPYRLRDILVSGNGASYSRVEVHETAEYDVADFATAPTDFVVSDIAVSPESPIAGRNARISATVKNLGEDAGETVSVAVHLVPPGETARQLGHIRVGPLAFGESATGILNWTTPQQPGQYAIQAIANSDRAIEEFDYSNNAANRSVTVQPDTAPPPPPPLPPVSNPDRDGDGVPDYLDGCPDDPRKTAPGLCGCGVSDADRDGDGVPDCLDACPDDPDKTEPGLCGCGVSDADRDGDGVPDCLDACPDDPGKTEPGLCGCGVSDADRDGDGVPDCLDACPDDPGKTEPGLCGCGVSDADRDGDGVPDCLDACPDDPGKTEPGLCGCGVSDADRDGDGVPDCLDACPDDPGKTEPGQRGCGVSETAPVARALVPETVSEGVSVRLDGSGSSDPGGGALIYEWRQVSGPAVVLSDESAPDPTFVPPPVDGAPIRLDFSLTVRNVEGLSDQTDATISVFDNEIAVFPAEAVSFHAETDRVLGLRFASGHGVWLRPLAPESLAEEEGRPSDLAYGMFELRIRVADPGDAAEVEILLEEPAPEGYLWYGFHDDRGWTDLGEAVAFDPDRGRAMLTVVDGGPDDADGLADGMISLTVGPGGTPEEGGQESEGDSGSGGICFISASDGGFHGPFSAPFAAIFLSLFVVSGTIHRFRK